jgi:hypothetical protein
LAKSDPSHDLVAVSNSQARAFHWGIAGYIVIKLVALCVLAINTQYLMDEFDTISHLQLLAQRPYQDVSPPRTLLSSYFYLPAYELMESSVAVMRMARAETLVIALVAIGLLYGISRNIGRSKFQSVLVVFAVLSFSTHMERAFTVRPEALMLLWALIGVWWLTRRELTAFRIAIAGLLSGAAFLTGQKAIYYDLAFGVALVGTALTERDLKRAISWGALLVSGWMIALAVYVGAFALSGAQPSRILETIFFGSAATNAVQGHSVYEALWTFKLQSFMRSAFPYLICLAGWLVTARRFAELSRGQRIALIFSGAVVLLIFGYHPAPWPYNLILAIPFVALWAPDCFAFAMVRFPQRTSFITMAFFAVFAISLHRNVLYLDHDNAYQEQVMEQAESLLAPEDRYFDGVFMLPKRQHTDRIWLERKVVLRIWQEAETGENTILERVFAQQPKVIILSYRTQAVEDSLRPYIASSYRQIAPNIMISAAADGGGETGSTFDFPPGAIVPDDEQQLLFFRAHNF